MGVTEGGARVIQFVPRQNERGWFFCPDDMPEELHSLLIQRGVRSAEEAARFLNPTVDQLHDPMRLNDMPRAVERIRRAIENQERICVFGDYDVDGVSAAAVLSDYLRTHGALDTEVYLPSRHTEGYGLNESAVREIAGRCRLMITVDCGVTSVDMVALAKSLGLDCVVTDHHEPGEALPDCPVVDPLLGDYPFKSLCGAGVAMKLIHALGGLIGAMLYVDIVALATVADVVPLIDENRVLVKVGLDRINRRPRTGIRALIEAAGLADKKISATEIAFRLAPRLNASGRIGSAYRAYELLLEQNPERAAAIAEELEGENRNRKAIEDRMQKEAEEQLRNYDFLKHRAIVLAGEDWNPGVIGLTASRLVEKYHYPVILLAKKEGGLLTGSCRSIPGVDIHAALTAAEAHLIRYGGHKQAAGLTMQESALGAFVECLDEYLRGVPGACYIPKVEYDTEIEFDRLTESLVIALDAMQPTGFGNPAPVMRARKAFLAQARRVGADGAHLRVTLSDSGVRRSGIFFGAGDRAELLPDTVDVLFTPEINVFNGRTSVDVKVRAMAPGNPMEQIEAKMPKEEELQREFLTELLYNKGINPSGTQKIELSELKNMLLARPQGTLILAGDLKIMAALTRALEDVPVDRFFREEPTDLRYFNAVLCYPHARIEGRWERIVFVGVPAEIEIPEGAQSYALAARPEWVDRLPDLDGLRSAYLAVKYVLGRAIPCEDYASLVHLVSRRAQQPYAFAAAALVVLDELRLITIVWDGEFRVQLGPEKKAGPENSAAWRRIQKWTE